MYNNENGVNCVMESIHEIIGKNEYNFLNTNENLKNKLMFLTFGGSHAYGTANPSSDIDIRGCALNSRSDLIGMSNFEQEIDIDSDTTIYSFNKLIKLVCACNPNTIEMLGCKPEHYVIYNSAAKELIDRRKMFLSLKAIESFSGYAKQQLRRMQNSLAHDSLSQADNEKHIMAAIKSAMVSFEDRYKKFPEGSISLVLDKSQRDDMDMEIFVNVDLKHYPLRDYRSIWADMNNIIKEYGKLNHRNNKKSELSLSKHMMHLLRLYMMCIDILEKEEIITYRENERELLLTIRKGDYISNGVVDSAFYDLLNDYEKKLEYAKNNTSLPETPNLAEVNDFVMSVNKRVVLGEFGE